MWRCDVLLALFWKNKGFQAASRLICELVYLQTVHTGCMDAESCFLFGLSAVTFPLAAMFKVLIHCSVFLTFSAGLELLLVIERLSHD